MVADVINDADIDLDAPEYTPRVYVPAEIGREPENAWDALRSAQALLREEGRWGKFIYYERSQVDYSPTDNPYCGSWKACAVGALQLVTMGLQYRPALRAWRPLEDGLVFVGDDRIATHEEALAQLGTQRFAIYEGALALLNEAALKLGDPVGNAIYYNDRDVRTRDEVLYMYDVAIGMAAS